MNTSITTNILTGLLSLCLFSTATAADFIGSLKGVTITDVQATNKPPTAAFTYTVSGEAVTLNASESTDPDGTISKYIWDFGNGTTASGVSATFQLTTDVTPVTLTVIDDKGGVSIAQKTANRYVEPFEIIVDDADPSNFSMVGSWTNSTSTPGYYNTGCKFAPPGTGSSVATWSMDIPINGKYELFCYYTASSQRATNAPFVIMNNGITIGTVAVNQRMNGGVFFSLGQYALTKGQLKITLSNAADSYVIADAVKAKYIP